MSQPTNGRLVLVTGASKGIGRGVAEAFAAQRARVVINYPGGNDEDAAADEAAAAVEERGGMPILAAADVGDPAALTAMIDRVTAEHGTIDVLVNNAGICPFRDFFDIDVDLWDRVHAVNLRACFVASQHVARGMVERGRGGRIISMSSISAWVGGAQQVHYCPTKAGISSLMKSLAIVLGPHGITCNAVLPGAIATTINEEDLALPGKREYLTGRIPVGRIGEPADIADVVTFLASDASRYVNGSELLVDGGMFVNLQ